MTVIELSLDILIVVHIFQFNSFIIIQISRKLELSNINLLNCLKNEVNFSHLSQLKNDGLFKDFRLYRQLTIFVPRRITLISYFSHK